ncbi:MAG: hypothetical protein ONB06_10420 [candidate division KSB1 bacterium]|nr:hypothetical protein [candidate division KSB1 bacterium]
MKQRNQIVGVDVAVAIRVTGQNRTADQARGFGRVRIERCGMVQRRLGPSR